jgi:hypothetical protein
MNVSPFLFGDPTVAIFEELEDRFGKLKFEIRDGNTASFQLSDDGKIIAYFKTKRDASQFHYQLCNVVREVWSNNFARGDLEVGSFEKRSTSFSYVTWDMFHYLRIKGENLASNGYNITLECKDKNPSSKCTIS